MKIPGYIVRDLLLVTIFTTFMVLFITLPISPTNDSTLGESILVSSKTSREKRRVKKESDWKKYYGSCPEDLKKTLNDLVDKILVELSCHYIKHLAKQTLKKQDNSSSMEFSPNPLTAESLPTIIATSSQGTSEKTIMMETDKIVDHIRDWAKERVDSLDGVQKASIINWH